MVDSPYTLQWAAIFPLKIAHLRGRIWTPIEYIFLGTSQIHIPNGISVRLAVFAGLTS